MSYTADLGVAIFDLDGTLCDDSHRVHLAENQRYDEYHKLCYLDSPRESVCELLRCWVARGGIVAYSTGRCRSQMDATFHWLGKHALPVIASITMRRPFDVRSSTELKEATLDTLLAGYGRVAFAVDDCEPVVQMYRRRGIECLQVGSRSY